MNDAGTIEPGRAASWLVTALAGLALSGAVFIASTALSRQVQFEEKDRFRMEAAREETFKYRLDALTELRELREDFGNLEAKFAALEAQDWVRVRDLPQHIVPAQETLRRLGEHDEALVELRKQLRDMERDGASARHGK